MLRNLVSHSGFANDSSPLESYALLIGKQLPAIRSFVVSSPLATSNPRRVDFLPADMGNIHEDFHLPPKFSFPNV